MDYQWYAIVGIGIAGLIANEIIEYKNKSARNQYIARVKQLTNQAQEITQDINSKLSKLLKSLEDKIKERIEEI